MDYSYLLVEHPGLDQKTALNLEVESCPGKQATAQAKEG